jgi:hypothetical protein
MAERMGSIWVSGERWGGDMGLEDGVGERECRQKIEQICRGGREI